MNKIANGLWKGVKALPHVAIGCLVYGGVTAASNFHPSNPLVNLLWNAVGIGAVAGVSQAVTRWANWNPEKART